MITKRSVIGMTNLKLNVVIYFEFAGGHRNYSIQCNIF